MEELVQNIKMLIPDKETSYIFSISAYPSKRGSSYYNKVFKKKNINCIYIPLLIKTYNHFKKFLNFLKNGIVKVKGISISMPLKSYAARLADYQHISVKLSNNANTLIYKKKKFYAYNCDYIAGKKIFKKNKFDNFVILGAGSLALSFVSLFKGKKIFILNRTKKNIQKIIRRYKNVDELSRENSTELNNICIINATPKYNHKELLKLVNKKNVKYICDCIIEKKSKLEALSKKYSIRYTDGYYFYKIQRYYQRRIYLNGKI